MIIDSFATGLIAGPGLHRVRRWAERTATWTKKTEWWQLADFQTQPESPRAIGWWDGHRASCKLTARAERGTLSCWTAPCFEADNWRLAPGQWWLCLFHFVTIQRDISLLKGPLSHLWSLLLWCRVLWKDAEFRLLYWPNSSVWGFGCLGKNNRDPAEEGPVGRQQVTQKRTNIPGFNKGKGKGARRRRRKVKMWKTWAWFCPE